MDLPCTIVDQPITVKLETKAGLERIRLDEVDSTAGHVIIQKDSRFAYQSSKEVPNYFDGKHVETLFDF